MKYFLNWLLDEKIILLVGAVVFALFALLLIKWKVDSGYISSFVGLVSLLVGALVRGIVGPNGNLNDQGEKK